MWKTRNSSVYSLFQALFHSLFSSHHEKDVEHKEMKEEELKVVHFVDGIRFHSTVGLEAASMRLFS